MFGCAIAGGEPSPRLPSHRGVGAARWWPLETLRYKFPAAAAQSDAVDALFLGDIGDSPWLTDNLRLLRDYLDAAESLRVPNLTCHISERASETRQCPPWLRDVRSGAARLGYDVTYCTGSFSFIEGAYASAPDRLSRLYSTLNAHGLFDDRATVDDFMAEYQRCLDAGSNLETLDGAIVVELWEDVGATGLRSAH